MKEYFVFHIAQFHYYGFFQVELYPIKNYGKAYLFPLTPRNKRLTITTKSVISPKCSAQLILY